MDSTTEANMARTLFTVAVAGMIAGLALGAFGALGTLACEHLHLFGL